VKRRGEAFNEQSPENGFIDLHEYNHRSELIETERYEWTESGGTGDQLDTKGDFVYVYDNIGNRETSNVDEAANPMTYDANDLNQYDSTSYPTESFSYDEDGNLEQDGSYDYTWDCENRLIEVAPTSPVDEDLKLKFAYDYVAGQVEFGH